MKRTKRVAAGLVATAALASLLTVEHQATATTADTHRTGQSVTLITGDRVTVLAGNAFAVEHGPGRDGITFQTRRAGDQLSVLPSDAAPLVAAGQLDRRLFDVTTLLAYGYDDRRTDLPLIVMEGTSRATVPSAGATVDRRSPRLGAVAMRQDRRKRGELWRALTGGPTQARTMSASVRRVWLDGLREPALDVSVPRIGAPAAWDAGYTGAGVTVAVLDTGVDDTHPDLAGKVTARANFTEGGEDDRDLAGHGTHVAATIAGNGATYRGVAPQSTLVDGKVCVVDWCTESSILAGMEWAAAEQNATIVNMSLGGFDTPETDPLEQAVNTLTERYGTLFVVAAGNDGPSASTVNSPGSADAALTVGAVDGADQVADFSSRGPRLGDGGLKPDITAPGVAITAARALEGGYATMSGTSMATPHVAGAAAILAQRHPEWTPGRLKAALMGSAAPTAGVDAFAQGAGRVDVAAALAQTVSAEPASVSFGEQRWPHTDDDPVARTIIYHNAGTSPVDLALTVEGSGGTFTVNPATVPVPAGGTAAVTVTADTRVPGPDGVVTGTLTATGSGRTVRTPLAVAKEVESYDIRFDKIGRDGKPSYGWVDLYAMDRPASYFLNEPTIRLPKGRYQLSALMLEGLENPEPGAMTLLVQPVLDVSGAGTVTLDARLAKPSAMTVPDASASLRYVHIGFDALVNGIPLALGQVGSSFEDILTAQIGPAPAGSTSNISAQWTHGTDVYQMNHHQTGRLISGYQREFSTAELAMLRIQISGGDEDGIEGGWYAYSRVPGQLGTSILSPVYSPLPSKQTWYVSTGGGIEWRSGLEQPGRTVGPWTRYRTGVTYHRVWNQAVFAPVLPGPDDFDTGVTRTGNRITVDFSPYGDGAGRVGRVREAGTTALFRDGVEVGRNDVPGSGEFIVPAGNAAYRLQTHAERGAPYRLSTVIDTAWTFRSGTVGDATVLPLWTVRFSPSLDGYNTAPAGRPFAVPVVVSPAPGAETGRPRTPTVEVSYDDGATWTGAPVVKGAAVLRHPTGEGYVSLRATATDTAGNTITQTVIHAYHYA